MESFGSYEWPGPHCWLVHPSTRIAYRYSTFALEAQIPALVTAPEMVETIVPVPIPEMGQLGVVTADLQLRDLHFILPLPRGVGVTMSPLLLEEVLLKGLVWRRTVSRMP